MKRIIVIGCGAAGMMAAYTAATNGASVVLLEKNEKLGKKIYITGKGRWNDFLTKVVNGQKFLTSAIYHFPPEKTKEFLTEHGLKIKTERGNRVFPESDHASDVTKTFERALREAGVEILFHEQAERIAKTEEGFTVSTQENVFSGDCVLVCTGGMSYPSTGSTGDGYRFAKDFSHTVTALKPGLVGLNVKGDFYKDLQGLTLKNVTLSADVCGKTVYEEFGEMLFTHFGISGPIVLSLSSVLNKYDLSGVTLHLDLKPALSEEQLDKRILRDFEQYKNKQLVNALVDLLPVKLIDVVLAKSGVSGKKAVNSVTKEEREKLLKTLKNWEMKVYGFRGFEEAIITSGGVELKQIHPKTMESKLCKGLYFCGEVLDIDACTGGYNLQIAFSTGYAAGVACAKE